MANVAAAMDQPSTLISSIGTPTPAHLAYASALLGRFPEELTRAVHEPPHARALIFALVLAGSGEVEGGWEMIRGFGGEALEADVRSLLPLVTDQGADARLPLLDLALPALQNLSPDESRRFREEVERLIHSDGRVRLFEYALTHTLARRLRDGADPAARAGRNVRSFASVREEVEVLLSALAWAGSDGSPDAAHAAFESGARVLSSELGPISLRDRASVDLGVVDQSLTALEGASRAIQRRLLQACAECASHDGRLKRAEAELIRAIAESLDCPMPPVLTTG
jgi:hypothetical protein